MVHLHNFLNNYDKYNSGQITDTQLRKGLPVAGHLLTEKEFEF
jgi:hypothetical protein